MVIKSIGNSIALLPAIVPWMVFFMYKGAHRAQPFTTEQFDREYDYIVGESLSLLESLFFGFQLFSSKSMRSFGPVILIY